MRLPTLKPLGISAPFRSVPLFRTLGPGSVSSLLKIALDVAYVLLTLITGILLLALVAAIFVPLTGPLAGQTYIEGTGDAAREVPITRTLILFGLGATSAYFGGFLLILRNLRQIFRTLTQGDPFRPENVRRLRQIGLTLTVVTAGVAVAQGLIPSIPDPGFSEMLTPIFSVLVVFVLAEVFKEGARLRHEAELTI